MMDELDLLKRDWQKKEVNLPKLSYSDIHKMIWKKSSSIVKWILTISILEFLLPQLLYLLPSMQDGMAFYDNIGVSNHLLIASIVTYTVAIYFIVQFYKRYREISVLEDARSLMKKIIKTRRTVKHWIIFSLCSMIATIFIMVIGVFLSDNIAEAFPHLKKGLQNIPPEKLRKTLMLSIGGFGTFLVVFIGGIYFLLYGLLLRKLNKNYRELKQLEI